MKKDQELTEMITNIKETSQQCAKNIGYYVADTIDDIQIEKKERKLEKEREKELEHQKKLKRLGECERILADEEKVKDISTYQGKKQQLDVLRDKLDTWEKDLAHESKEFKEYRIKTKIMIALFCVSIVFAGLGFFGGEMKLLFAAALTLVLLFVYYVKVVEPAEKKADGVAPAEFLKLKDEINNATKEVERLENLKRVQEEYEKLKKELHE